MTRGPGLLPVPDQGARSRPAARRGIAHRSGDRAARRRAVLVRRRQPRRGAPLRAGAVAVDLLQPRHDPSVAAAQPRPLGGVPAEPAVHRRRRMPLLPRHFRLQCGDGAAPAAAIERKILGRRQPNRADGHLRQRHHRIAGGHRRGTDRPDRRARSPRTDPRRAHARSRCGNPRCWTTSSAKTAPRCDVPRARRPRV